MTSASPSSAHAARKRSPLKTVVFNGSLYSPSRTQALLHAIHREVCSTDALELETTFIELADIAKELGSALSVQELPESARQALEAVESADFLIIGSPVYRASMPGLFKHFFDLIEMSALVGKPVLLAATGGSPRHSLVIDLQLRPLFTFFQALTLPIGVYATQNEIEAGQIVDAALQARIALAVELARPGLCAKAIEAD